MISEADHDAERELERQVHLVAHPEIRERQEIERMMERAEVIIQGEDEDYDRGAGYALRHQAEQRLAAWRERYPAAAAEEDAMQLEDKAAHLRDLAVGALVYDADGWLSAEEQQKRHDGLEAEAAALDRQAVEIRSKT